ncbi:MAG: signal peptidase II [Chromatiales bacterium]|nr:signal peptidase II [Chromatiales bacterium]
MSWLWLSLAVLVLDQATKALALELLVLHRPVAVAPSLNLTLTYNTGAAFSLLSDAGGWQRWLFVGLAVAVCGFLLSWLRSVGAGDRWTPMALALVLGGAAGNLLDRVMRDGRVVDFIDVYVGQWHWPAFNVADSGICVGAVILIWKALEREPQD